MRAGDPVEVVRLRQALAGRERRAVSLPGYRAAAVLAPLVVPQGGGPLSLLFTVRHAGLPTHPGQIAFPGGKRDPVDASLEDTALREAEEELGLGREQVQVLGHLDDVPTPAGFVITPVVATVAGPLSLMPSAGEVAEVFQAPLADLQEVYRAGAEREFLGVRYIMHEYPYQRWRIWGATATMVHQLLGLLAS